MADDEGNEEEQERALDAARFAAQGAPAEEVPAQPEPESLEGEEQPAAADRLSALQQGARARSAATQAAQTAQNVQAAVKKARLTWAIGSAVVAFLGATWYIWVLLIVLIVFIALISKLGPLAGPFLKSLGLFQ